MRAPARWVIVSLAAALRVAHADPAEDAYREGRRLYDLQEWDQAIEKFKLAYKLRADAASLFNIAQAYRLKGDCPQASRSYKSYKRNFPTAANIDKIDKFIEQLEPCANKPPGDAPKPGDTTGSDAPKPGDPTVGGAQPQPEPPVTPTPDKKETPSTGPREVTMPKPRLFTWISLGAAGAALGTGVYFGIRARHEFDEYETTLDPARYDELRERIPRHQRFANIAYAAAGGLAIATGVLYFFEGSRTQTVRISVAPTTNGLIAWGRY